jgi:tRNA threonylcarbamoyl adenosine modification protein (Sua5/YciO/YrdC/YwlC family)
MVTTTIPTIKIFRLFITIDKNKEFLPMNPCAIQPMTLLDDLMNFIELAILFRILQYQQKMMSKAIFLKLYEANPEQKKVDRIVDILRNDGVIIYPTDTVYGIGCSISSRSAIDRVARFKGITPGKERFSLICDSLSQVADYTKNIHTPVFKLMKKALPGPYTFILNSSNKLPRLLNSAKKTVGVRIPNHKIPTTIVQQLGLPIITTSIRDEDEIVEYSTDPELIYEKFSHMVDVVIDGGYGNNVPSTVIDCTGEDFEILREGLGDINAIL